VCCAACPSSQSRTRHSAPPLERGGFEPHVVADPLAEFESGRVGKALVPTEKGLRLLTRTTSQDLRNIESIARDAIGAQWRISIEPEPPPADLRMPTRMVAALVAILFTLYGVVLARRCSTAIARRASSRRSSRYRSRCGRTRSPGSSRPSWVS
jgi:hypothetical protein